MVIKAPLRAEPLREAAGDLLAALWPGRTTRNSPLHRRKTLAIRGVQLAMVALVVIAIAGSLVVGGRHLPVLRLCSLIVVGAAYVAWSLYGSRDAVRFALWHYGTASPPPWPPEARVWPAVYLIVQLAMAELIIWLAGPANIVGLLWLVLLPPIGQSILFLRWPGIAAVSILSIAIHTLNMVSWYGWPSLALALPGFSVAVLFTLAFTQITVSAETARGEVEQLAGELSEANRKLREYALQAEELAASRERNRVAREIHDSIGHCLTVVHVQLEAARTTLERDPAHTLDAIGKAQAMTHAGLQEIRRSVAALRVSPLHNQPLPDAIRRLATEGETAGLKTQVTIAGDVRPLSPQAELTLFRAAQEALTNCRKHAHSQAAHVLLHYDAADVVRLAVSDEGVGAADTSHGFGLLGLRERAQLLGGQMRVRTAPGQGFTLEVEVPG